MNNLRVWATFFITISSLFMLYGFRNDKNKIQIIKKFESNFILNIGAGHGVKNGLKGYFWTNIKSGGKLYPSNIARFKVIRVEDRRCFVAIESIGEGFSEKDFQWASFIKKLIPPKDKKEIKLKTQTMDKSKKTELKKGKIVSPEISKEAEGKIPQGKTIIWYYEKGDEALRKNNYLLARKYYEQILALDASDPIALTKIKECNKLIIENMDKDKFNVYIKRADSFLQKKQFDYALKYYLFAYRVNPKQAGKIAVKFRKISSENKHVWNLFKKENFKEIEPVINTYLVKEKEKAVTKGDKINYIKKKAIKFYQNDNGFFEAQFIHGTIMVNIPEGEFVMGSKIGDGDPDEYPWHKVYCDSYWISKNEVSVEQYKKFLLETEYRALPESISKYSPSNKHPVVFVNWHDAMAYCKWLSKKTGLNFTLPTEAQWEKAARGGDQRQYPWGNSELTGEKANFADLRSYEIIKDKIKKLDKRRRKRTKNPANKKIDDGFSMIAPIGSFTKGGSPYGLLDLAGNVSEWTLDWADKEYYKNSPYKNPKGPIAGAYKITKGGSWISSSNGIRCSYRSFLTPSYFNEFVGFRVALELKVENE